MKEWDPTMRQPYQVQECSALLSGSGQGIDPDPGLTGLVLNVPVEVCIVFSVLSEVIV